ncbi:MAG: pirin family protein, partial [Actinomycetota bacterium]
MPAITAPDITKLERVPLVPGTSRQRPVRAVASAPRGLEGEGFPVRRAFAGADLTDLDPFVHMDQMGEVEYAPGEPKGTPWHPHRGFETVTYMIDGIFEHQDSNGGGGVITNGDTQWMTAGAGILHIERPPDHLVASGGLFHGIQLGEVDAGEGPSDGEPLSFEAAGRRDDGADRTDPRGSTRAGESLELGDVLDGDRGHVFLRTRAGGEPIPQ